MTRDSSDTCRVHTFRDQAEFDSAVAFQRELMRQRDHTEPPRERHSLKVSSDVVAHECRNGYLRPYPKILCSCCIPTRESTDLTARELCDLANRTAGPDLIDALRKIHDMVGRKGEHDPSQIGWLKELVGCAISGVSSSIMERDELRSKFKLNQSEPPRDRHRRKLRAAHKRRKHRD